MPLFEISNSGIRNFQKQEFHPTMLTSLPGIMTTFWWVQPVLK
jgi:hypothetical protein